jgi:hypothetical protein
MGKKIKTLKTQSKILLITEIVMILAFFLLTIIEILLTNSMNNFYNENQSSYFLYVMNSLMLQNSFFANYKIQNDSLGKCDQDYDKQVYLKLKYFENLQYSDVTSKVRQIIPGTNNQVYNNTFMGNRFFEIDLQNKGTSKVSLLYENVFNSIGGYYFCSMDFKMDQEYQALNIISTVKSCKNTFPNFNVADCGLYANNSYRLCLIKDFLYFNNNTSVLSLFPNKTDDFFCPYNNLKLEFSPNPDYDINDSKSHPNTMQIVESIMNTSPDPSLIDKSFFLNFSPIPIIGKAMEFTKPNDTYVYYDNTELLTYRFGEKYGFISPYSSVLYSANFVQYYFENFYKTNQKFFYNKNGVEKEMPIPFQSESLNSFYFITDSADKLNQINITFVMNTFPIISKKCFQNIFDAKSIFNISNFFNKLSTNYFFETSSILTAWLFAKLFITLWCYGKIRLYVLYEKYTLKLSLPDTESEAISFYTFKILSAGIFVIILTSLTINSNSYSYILNWIDEIVVQECFESKLNIFISAYSGFIYELDKYNNMISAMIWLSIVIELGEVVIFNIYQLTDNKPITIDNDDDDLNNSKEN